MHLVYFWCESLKKFKSATLRPVTERYSYAIFLKFAAIIFGTTERALLIKRLANTANMDLTTDF